MEKREKLYLKYDIHGNVDTLLQDYGSSTQNPNAMSSTGNRFKKMVYNYDLISGKVNSVVYQPDFYNHTLGQWQKPKDQFAHKYFYDAENRLTDVETSHDQIVWEKDARYSYYKHGPLARMILGQNQVQGVDYAYNLQGWLKGINSTSVGDGSFDMGQDGKTGSANSNIARDAYGLNLNYFTGDYKAIGLGVTGFANPFAGVSAGNDLFNGNIKSMAVNIPKLGNALAYGFTYDQLNRLTKMDAYNGLNSATNVFTPVVINDYKERLSYDPNGNIKTYLRNGTTAGGTSLAMDDMVYTYKPNTNQLSHVTDAVPATNYSIDIDNQSMLNYTYDQIGNLTKDVAQGIDNIEWNVYGKITKIQKSNGTTITYAYDPAGNKISKTVNNKSAFYVKDATGNTMSTYTKDPAANSGALTRTEAHLYGSSRIGVNTVPVNVETAGTTGSGILQRGFRLYDGTNQKSTPIVTFTDRVIQHSSNGTTVDYLNADVVSASDNYAFGSPMPGRTFSPDKAVYGLDGKRKDNDIYGEGNAIDFEARILDTRLGRWFSLDPLQKKYPSHSPYNYALNSPLFYSDIDGKDVGVTITRNPQGGGTITFYSTTYVSGIGAEQKVAAFNEAYKAFAKANPDMKSSDGKWKVEMKMNFVNANDIKHQAAEKSEMAAENYMNVSGAEGRSFANQRLPNSRDNIPGSMVNDVDPSGNNGRGLLLPTTYTANGRFAQLYSNADGRTGVHEEIHNWGIGDYYADVIYDQAWYNEGRLILQNTGGSSASFEGFEGTVMSGEGLCMAQQSIDDLVNIAHKTSSIKKSDNFVMARKADTGRANGSDCVENVPQRKVETNGTQKTIKTNPRKDTNAQKAGAN